MSTDIEERLFFLLFARGIHKYQQETKKKKTHSKLCQNDSRKRLFVTSISLNNLYLIHLCYSFQLVCIKAVILNNHCLNF